MENLQIVSTTINVQAKEIINGNTVNYSYNYVEGNTPLAIVFNVCRGTAEDENFTNEVAITGTYFPQNQTFNNEYKNFQIGDAALLENVFATCQGIVSELE